MSLLKHLNERKRYRNAVPLSNLLQNKGKLNSGNSGRYNTNSVWKGINIQAETFVRKEEKLSPLTCQAGYNQPEQLLKISMCLSLLCLMT